VPEQAAVITTNSLCFPALVDSISSQKRLGRLAPRYIVVDVSLRSSTLIPLRQNTSPINLQSLLRDLLLLDRAQSYTLIMECKVDDYGENRKSYRSSQVELGPISEWTMDDGQNEARFWLYVIPKIKASSLKLPTLPENPDVDGAKWILMKTGTESEALAEMQRIIETKLKQSRDVANIVTDLVDCIEEHDHKWIYLSGLIVQDKSMKVKGLIREGRSDLAIQQSARDPTLADCIDADGRSCTEVAARFGDLKVLRALLAQDPLRINKKSADSHNLLHHAARRNHPNVDVIDFLCSHEVGRLAGQRNLEAMTPLQIALVRGVLENVKCLLPYTKLHLGAPSSGKGRPATCTAIDSLRGFSDERLCHILKLLLEIVPVDAQDDQGWTALRYAAEYGEECTWELLLRGYRADPNIRDFHGSTAITGACEKLPLSYLEVLEKESQTVIDWWSIDDDGDTPLSLAQRNKDPEVVKFVATKTIEPNALEALEFFWYDPVICADIHTSLENYDVAIMLLEQAGPYEDWKMEALKFHKTGRLKLKTNAPEAAEALLKQSLALYDTRNPKYHGCDSWTVACIHTTLAKAFMMQSRFLDALESINTALSTEWRPHEKRILLGLQIRAKQASATAKHERHI